MWGRVLGYNHRRCNNNNKMKRSCIKRHQSCRVDYYTITIVIIVYQCCDHCCNIIVIHSAGLMSLCIWDSYIICKKVTFGLFRRSSYFYVSVHPKKKKAFRVEDFKIVKDLCNVSVTQIGLSTNNWTVQLSDPISVNLQHRKGNVNGWLSRDPYKCFF